MIYEGYLYYEICRACHVILRPPTTECPVCLKPFDECRKLGAPKMNDLTLRELQEEQRPWVKHNFPDREAYYPLLGIMEELGELSHAHLKMLQGIRGSEEELREEARDAIGDIIVFLSDYCSANDYNLQAIIEEVWDKVKKRDWKANPLDADAIAQADGP